jgi:NADPH-dependent glutamate synthase beta subunit-like oxidoreductase/Pyruvate/2-oxoacid:ferredoxin oxidoreductase delta subunit
MAFLKERKPLQKKPATLPGAGTRATSNERPRWAPKIPPCINACPNNNDIRGAIVAIGQREKFGQNLEQAYQTAWRLWVATSPFPAVCGRVCPHPCEAECNRTQLEGPVNINTVERFLGDKALAEGWRLSKLTEEKREEKIAVIGSGPAGFSCAYQLARRGYPVTIFEAFSKPGGMLRYGIPAYRLPRDILDKEIQRILDLGVELRLNCAVGKDIPFDDLRKQYRAVFVGIGAHRGRLLGVEGEDAPNVISGQEFLNQVNSGKPVDVGEKVLVVGGGDTAIDAARVSKRLGAGEVTIVYRRTIEEMPAIDAEIEEAQKEGIKLEFLAAPVAFHKEGERASGMKCLRMKLGEPDASGRRRPIPIEGSEFDIAADVVIAAISQEPDFQGLESVGNSKDWIKADEGGRTAVEDVYAGGDATKLDIAVVAIAQGRHAAETITAALGGQQRERPAELPIIKADKMKLSYYEKAERNAGEQIPVGERFAGGLDLEINKTMSDEQALAESARCMSCGQCFLCGACWMYCQVSAIKQAPVKGEPYTFELKYCDGCKKCAEECPCGYIEMYL